MSSFKIDKPEEKIVFAWRLYMREKIVVSIFSYEDSIKLNEQGNYELNGWNDNPEIRLVVPPTNLICYTVGRALTEEEFIKRME